MSGTFSNDDETDNDDNINANKTQESVTSIRTLANNENNTSICKSELEDKINSVSKGEMCSSQSKTCYVEVSQSGTSTLVTKFGDAYESCKNNNNLNWKNMALIAKDSINSVFSFRFLRAHLPFIDWIGSYNIEKCVGDFIAGSTTALTVIPQGIGYASLAGLPLQYGLYSSIMPGFVYAVLGARKEITIGPTAVNSLMSFNYAGGNVAKSVTLSFFAGLIEITVGLLNLGFLVNFVSLPVISAFTSAVSIQVSTSQVLGLLGLKSALPNTRGFTTTWLAVFSNVHLIKPYDASLGFISIGILLFLRKFKDLVWCSGIDVESRIGLMIKKAKWLISISRNCLVVFGTTLLAYYVVEVAENPNAFELTGNVEKSGLPRFQFPWHFGNNNNATLLPVSPIELAEDLSIGLFMLPLVSLLQHIAIAKFYCPAGRGRVDASQEMVALGTSQLMGSFVGSMCVTASFGRSAVNEASGVCTPFGGIVTGTILILTCAFFTPYFAFIPNAALSAIIISAMIFTLDVEILLPMWRSKKLDFLPYLLTFITGLFVSVEIGLIAGILSHFCLLIYRSNQPNIVIRREMYECSEYILVKPDRALLFPTVDKICSSLSEAATCGQERGNDPLPIVLDLSAVLEIDYTSAKGIRDFVKSRKSDYGQFVYICGISKDIEDVLSGVDSTAFFSYVNLHEVQLKIVQKY